VLAHQRGEDGFGALGCVQVVRHGADDVFGILLRARLDDGAEVVLPLEHVRHLLAVQTDADHAPVHGESLAGQFVAVDTLVGTVESADPEVDDAVVQVGGVVGDELRRDPADTVAPVPGAITSHAGPRPRVLVLACQPAPVGERAQADQERP
jgi:hypothetical protein